MDSYDAKSYSIDSIRSGSAIANRIRYNSASFSGSLHSNSYGVHLSSFIVSTQHGNAIDTVEDIVTEFPTVYGHIQ